MFRYVNAEIKVGELNQDRVHFQHNPPPIEWPPELQERFLACYGEDDLNHAVIYKKLPENQDKNFVRKPFTEIDPPKPEDIVTPTDIALQNQATMQRLLAELLKLHGKVDKLLSKP